jgi:hypothetical protein
VVCLDSEFSPNMGCEPLQRERSGLWACVHDFDGLESETRSGAESGNGGDTVEKGAAGSHGKILAVKQANPLGERACLI